MLGKFKRGCQDHDNLPPKLEAYFDRHNFDVAEQKVDRYMRREKIALREMRKEIEFNT